MERVVITHNRKRGLEVKLFKDKKKDKLNEPEEWEEIQESPDNMQDALEQEAEIAFMLNRAIMSLKRKSLAAKYFEKKKQENG